jgi:peptidoglycan/xylan/chitin deacetylase (PgdA/CDA1 family)
MTLASAQSAPVAVAIPAATIAADSEESDATVAQASAPEAPATVAQRSAADAPMTVAQASAPAAASPAPMAAGPSCPGNPNALGVARTVEVDTTGGPGFGFEHFRTHDFLQQGEVVLTFDDGPWPGRTTAVLAALQAHCTKAIFFPIGKHATYEPGIMKQVAAAGHAVGSHTWSHQDLSKKTFEESKDEIEKGISAVAWAVGGPIAPYFRFPALRHPPEVVTYLGERNIGIFSTDMDSFDFKMRKPEQVRQAVLAKLKKHGKGIVLMHDFQQATAAAAAELLKDLKANGYKIVFMKAKDPLKTIASYDELIRKDSKLPTVSSRPTSSVIRTISE